MKAVRLGACGLLSVLAIFAEGGVAITGAKGSSGTPFPVVVAEMRNHAGGGPLSLFNLPNGGGRSFDRAFVPGGVPADATITVTLTDSLGVPIEFFPFEDIWLESLPDAGQRGMIPCRGNATCDANTDEFGETVFAEALFAGGQSTNVTHVVLSGNPIWEYPLALQFNSADIDGNGTVDLTDGGFFTLVLFGDYDYAADFNFDGIVNVTDAGIMSSSIGARCPVPIRTESVR